ncbi:MAG: DUF5685 family protein [Oscillospiraceae bacterium]|jgi:hypothetical protein|nr:DUF5685 family protein [Oscillospiraceae bacterium]
MFGYVLPRFDKLAEADAARYRAAYCGLCRSLKEAYGFRARFLVNYDMTFLYFLLYRGEREQAERCACPARPFCKKDCLPGCDVLSYCADLTVLLSVWKLRDARRDGSFFKSMGAGIALAFYRKAYLRAASRHPKLDEEIGKQLERLQALEDAHCSSIDRTADAFAQILSRCAGYFEEEAQRRAAGQLLYHVGRFLYLADALEDLPKDNRTGSYNPLRYRYALQDGRLTQADKQQLTETVDTSVSVAASAFELMQHIPDAAILSNVIYYGLPAVLHSVAAGTFRKRRRKHERSV